MSQQLQPALLSGVLFLETFDVDTAHANLRLGFGATGLWDLGPLALGSLALGHLACLWLQVPVHHAFRMFVGE